MADIRTYALAGCVLIAPAIPVMGVQLYHAMQGSTAYQPLGVSRERLALADAENGLAPILVEVKWGQGVSTAFDRVEFLDLVEAALAARTDSYAFEVIETEGENVFFTFRVANSEWGPYTPSDVARGVQDSITQQKMHLFNSTE